MLRNVFEFFEWKPRFRKFGDVNLAFSNLLTEEVILERYCEVCMARHDASVEKRVKVSGKYLIIQFKRFFLNEGNWIKDLRLIKGADEQLSFSVELHEKIQHHRNYHLVASVCHSGTRDAGHYTAHVFHKQSRQWLLCNDKAILPIQSSMLNNKHSYVLFYEMV